MEVTEAVARDTGWVLVALGQQNIRATFFVLGNVAQKFPSLIRQIAEANHEIGVLVVNYGKPAPGFDG